VHVPAALPSQVYNDPIGHIETPQVLDRRRKLPLCSRGRGRGRWRWTCRRRRQRESGLCCHDGSRPAAWRQTALVSPSFPPSESHIGAMGLETGRLHSGQAQIGLQIIYSFVTPHGSDTATLHFTDARRGAAGTTRALGRPRKPISSGESRCFSIVPYGSFWG
jgi:hypothetical protein